MAFELGRYQHVKMCQTIASLRDDAYKAQLDGAQASLRPAQARLDELRLQEEVTAFKITQAEAGVTAAESQIAAAPAGINTRKDRHLS